MPFVSSSNRVIKASQIVFFTVLFLSLGLFGCDNSCILIVSNPGGSGGTVSGSNTSCPLTPANGNVRVRVTSSLPLAAQDESDPIQHVFVTFRGIEANPSINADDGSSDWQEFAPKLATHPVQLDLLARSGDSCEAGPFESVAVPADSYRQIRLRLSPNQSDSNDPILDENSCGSIGFNCIVTSDGDIRPLDLDSKSSQIQISSDNIVGGFVRLLPESAINLKIEFNPQFSRLTPAAGMVRLVPVFTIDSQTGCESTAGAAR